MDVKLTPTGDVDLSTGDYQLIEGTEERAQQVARNLKTWLGEVFVDSRIGMPWRRDVFKRPASLSLIKARIRQMVLATDGVAAVLAIQLDFDSASRNLAISQLRIKDTDGEVITFTNLPII